MTPEGKVKKRVKAIIETRALQDGTRIYTNWPVPIGYGESTLDCIGCHRGQFFAIETKAPGKKLTPRQQMVKELMVEAGARVFVIDGDEGCQELWTWLAKS